MTLSERVEALKLYLVNISLRYHQFQADRCLQWLREREERSVERAMEKTLDCGYVYGKFFKLKSEDK